LTILDEQILVPLIIEYKLSQNTNDCSRLRSPGHSSSDRSMFSYSLSSIRSNTSSF